jgi:hypothetical protein
MAICLITNNPNETAEQYERVMSHLRDSGPVPPDDARLLIAGQGPGGWRAISVWADHQPLQRFFEGRLTAAYHAASVSPKAATQETFEIHTPLAAELAAQKSANALTSQDTRPARAADHRMRARL